MKKIISILCIVCSSLLVQSQIEFNGIELGTIQKGEMMIKTTYDNIDGVILLNKIPVFDSIYQITFYPSEDGASIVKIQDTAAKRIIKSIEDRYKIKFFNVEGSKSNDMFYKTIKDDVEYGYHLTSNEKNSEVVLMIWFINQRLEKFK